MEFYSKTCIQHVKTKPETFSGEHHIYICIKEHKPDTKNDSSIYTLLMGVQDKDILIIHGKKKPKRHQPNIGFIYNI